MASIRSSYYWLSLYLSKQIQISTKTDFNPKLLHFGNNHFYFSRKIQIWKKEK